MTETYTNILFLMKTKNGNILTFSDKMQISAILCFLCDWFCPMMSHLVHQDPQQRLKYSQFLLTSEINISKTVADRSIVTINHIQEIIFEVSFSMVTFDLEPLEMS